MIFAGICGGKIVELKNAVSVEINQSLDIPADDMAVVFQYSDDFPDISRIYALDKDCIDIKQAVENREVIFSGVVDEVVLSADTSKAQITVYARSMAALLLDNECKPQTYINPDTDLIYINHIKRFGIGIMDVNKAKKTGVLNIYKGYSHYKAAEKYFSDFLNAKMRIDHRGICIINGLNISEYLNFDNYSGITFNSISICDENYNRISKVFVCNDNMLNYDTVIKDRNAIEKGIIRERYLNINSSSDCCLADADRLIKEGKNNTCTVTLQSDERVLNKLGYRCTVNTPISIKKKLTVGDIHFAKTGKKEKTVIKLIQDKEDSYVDTKSNSR